jgi:hypothetical protein
MLRSVYGSTGDDVSQELMSLCNNDNNDFFRRLMYDKLIVPLNKHVFSKIEKKFRQALGRDVDHQVNGMSGSTLDVIVTLLECIAAQVFVAAAVALVYNLRTTKSRMIVAPFAAFACVFPVFFLSKDARFFYTLTVA